MEQEPRLERGAYITDGTNLYEVTGSRVRAGVMGVRTVLLVVEDCRDLDQHELVPERVRASFVLVRRAPIARCPDRFDQIVWDAEPPAASTPMPLPIRETDRARRWAA